MILINGSPRKEKTSYQFAKSFAMNASEDCEILWVHDLLKDMDLLIKVLDEHERVGFFSPLYVDTVPAPLIELLEKLNDYSGKLHGKGVFSVGQSGFPEANLMEPMHMVFKCFTERHSMKWMGSLSYGGGAIIDGTPLDDLGGRGKKICEGMRMAYSEIESGHVISDSAQRTLELKIPRHLKPLLCKMLNFRAKQSAKKFGVDIYSKPYL